MFPPQRSSRELIFVCFAGMAALLAPNSSGQVYSIVASFNGTSNIGPEASLAQGTDGNLYGTTNQGTNNGSVFKLTPAGTITTLYVFSSPASTGAHPTGKLVQGANGNFYGTTQFGGLANRGTVFEITPQGTLTTLTSFVNESYGAGPGTGLIAGTDGNFYGTTEIGGVNGDGSIFRITPTGTLTTVYSFGSLPAQADGRTPYGDLVLGRDENIYGTAFGGPHNSGIVFMVTPAGVVRTLYAFAGTDGAGPTAGLIQATDGNLYGTTQQGGMYGQGTVFRLTPSGVLTTIYSFGATAADGMQPAADLLQASDGNLYGTTEEGGTYQFGTVFKITLTGAMTIVHSLGVSPTDGQIPYAGLIQDTDGNLYGTTGWGGANKAGTVYRIQLAGSAYTCTNTTPPVITNISSASAFGGYSYFASGSWLEIKGTNLADPSDPRLVAGNPGQWTSSDFNGVNAPASLDGISVSINGKAAFVDFISTGQINVQAPEDAATGNVAITVTNCKATSAPVMVARHALAPGFLAPNNWQANNTYYMVATFASDGAYVLSTYLGSIVGVNSRPARPGDLIVAYGIGFGDVTPATLPGVIVGQSNALVNPITLSFGSTPAELSYAGLAGSFVGLYEFYITVPSPLANGDYPIIVKQNGAAVPQAIFLTVQN
jgi:uncharacterized protein (TIGR03437 family)